jgi:molecular chaperone HtpG
VGELHILDQDVIPNGRRDHFEPSAALSSLVNRLVPLGRELSRRCRVSSQIRNRARAFERGKEKVEELLSRVEQGVVRKRARSVIQREIVGMLSDLERIAGTDLFPTRMQKSLQRKLEKLRHRYTEASGVEADSDILASLPRARRSAFQQFVELLYECSSNKAAAKLLVDRMTTRLAACQADGGRSSRASVH